MRKRIYEAIELAKEKDRISNVYNFFMMVVIIVSILPLMIRDKGPVITVLDRIAMCIFILEYIIRWINADYKLKKGKLSFLIYPFTPFAIIDLLSILPSLRIVNKSVKVLRVFRLIQTFRVFRIFKVVRYSKNKRILITAFQKQKTALLAVLGVALGYIWVAALIVFNVEPKLFKSFFEALYWATVSLTTIGYGDITPVTTIGRLVTVVSSILGIAIIALPSGIITAGIMDELNEDRSDKTAEEDDK